MRPPDRTVVASGAGSIAVQIGGDNNRLTIGGSELLVDRIQLRKKSPANITELLLTDCRATSLVGRDDELGTIDRWRRSANPVSVNCVVGRAGSGKTRLAIEACDRAEADGWFAGFVSHSELARFDDQQNLISWHLSRDVLLAIDYAASSVDILKSWFALLASRRNLDDAGRLRILLIERQANHDEGWWSDLRRVESLSSASAVDIIDPEAPITLTPLERLQDRRALFAEAMALAGPRLEPPVQVRTPPRIGENPSFDRQLAQSEINTEPLYLIMAAVHAAEHGGQAGLSLGKVKLAERMADIELARTVRFARSRGYRDGARLLKHLVACITLQNGCPVADLTSLIEDELAAEFPRSAEHPRDVAEQILDFLPENASKVEGVRPDLIGESLVVELIEGGRLRSEVEATAMVLRAYGRDPRGVIETLIRCSRDLAPDDPSHGSVRWLRSVADATETVSGLELIARNIPVNSVSLRELATDLQTRIVAKIEPLEGRSEEIDLALTIRLTELAIRLGSVGRHEEAVEAARKATIIRRQLSLKNPVHGDMLPTTLCMLATALRYSERPDEALAAANEAVALCRQQVLTAPDESTERLAFSLKELVDILVELGRPQEALAAGEEAADLYRMLWRKNPDEHALMLAVSLSDLSKRLSAFSRFKEALAPAEEAAELYRTLAFSALGENTLLLVAALESLSSRYRDVGRHAEALAAANEEVGIRRYLAQSGQESFRSGLAASLSRQACFFDECGDAEDAIASANEAVEMYRALVATDPQPYLPRLAGSLINLSNVLATAGRNDQAAMTALEAVGHFGELNERDGTFGPQWASSLRTLAIHAGKLGLRAQALSCAEQSVRLSRMLVENDPALFTPELAKALCILCEILEQEDRPIDALNCCVEAVVRMHQFVEVAPEAYASDLATYVGKFIRLAEACGMSPQEASQITNPAMELLEGVIEH